MMELKSLLLVAVSSVVTLLFCEGAAAARKPPAGARRFLRTFPQYRRTGVSGDCQRASTFAASASWEAPEDAFRCDSTSVPTPR